MANWLWTDDVGWEWASAGAVPTDDVGQWYEHWQDEQHGIDGWVNNKWVQRPAAEHAAAEDAAAERTVSQEGLSTEPDVTEVPHRCRQGPPRACVAPCNSKTETLRPAPSSSSTSNFAEATHDANFKRTCGLPPLYNEILRQRNTSDNADLPIVKHPPPGMGHPPPRLHQFPVTKHPPQAAARAKHLPVTKHPPVTNTAERGESGCIDRSIAALTSQERPDSRDSRQMLCDDGRIIVPQQWHDYAAAEAAAAYAARPGQHHQPTDAQTILLRIMYQCLRHFNGDTSDTDALSIIKMMLPD